MSYLRYFKRHKATLQCKTITPMFLGNAHQEAEWRAAPFKALFRYWWRVTQHHLSTNDLRKREGELFGTAGKEDASGKSLFSIAISSETQSHASRESLPLVGKVHHPEVSRDSHINPLLYLAGMGLTRQSGRNLVIKNSYFSPNSRFDLQLSLPEKYSTEIIKALSLIKAFGAVGARSRNGWGSFQFTSAELDLNNLQIHLDEITRDWPEGMREKDFPNCLGRDTRGPLIWKTKAEQKWAEVMKHLADTYIGLRARTVNEIPRLNPNGSDQPDERHLLGFPLSKNHPARQARNWGSSGRHASPLRFVVHQVRNEFQGFILHLPHRHSKEMPFPAHINQPRVWEKVHKKLDGLLERANYSEVLA